jgi:hypothetical protein
MGMLTFLKLFEGAENDRLGGLSGWFLVEKRFVALDVIDDRLGLYTISNWKKLEPWIVALRKEKSDKTVGEHFQRLYEKTIKHLRKR